MKYVVNFLARKNDIINRYSMEISGVDFYFNGDDKIMRSKCRKYCKENGLKYEKYEGRERDK